MVDDFMLDDSIIKNKGHLGADILNNIIKNLSIADEAIEEACHEINKHDELYEMHFESFENDIQDFNKFRWEYEDFTSYADEYDAMVDSKYKSRMESICEQLSDIRLENIQIDNNLGIVDSEGSHYDTFEGTRLKHKINIEDVLKVEPLDKAMKSEYEERRQMVQTMQKMVDEDNWPEGTSEDTKEAVRQYLSNLNGGKMESYDDEIKNLLTKGEFNFITDKEQNLSLALDFVPIVGDIKGIIEAIQGKEMITNRELSDEEKTMAGISSAVGFIPGVGKVGTLAKAGGKLGAKAMIKNAAKYAVKETMKGAGMYGASSIATNLGISPKDQLMAIGGISLYKGGKAVLKNPRVVSAVNNSADITKATIKNVIESSSGTVILNSNFAGTIQQLRNSFKKVTEERKILRDNIEKSNVNFIITPVPKDSKNINLKMITNNNALDIANLKDIAKANPLQVEEVNKVKNPKIDLINKEHPHNRTKAGNYGEMKTDIDLESTGRYSRISDERVTNLEDPVHHGIDGVYKNTNPPPEYIIVDSKYLSSDRAINTNKAPTLNNTKNGRQLSDSWILKNIDNVVDEEIAKQIKRDIKFSTGNTERVIAKIDNTGNITYYKVNNKGNVIKEDEVPYIWIP